MDINSVIIFGRVGRDPELREMPNGDPICSFAIANSSWKKAGTEWKEDTSWIDCTVYGDAAKRFVERTKKGHGVTVQGSLKQRTWEDKDGNKREKVQINVRGIQFHEKKPKAKPDDELTAPVERDKVPF